MSITIQVRFYAGLAQRAGCREATLELADGVALPDPRVADALAAVAGAFPTLRGMLDRVAVALDDTIVHREHPLRAGALLELLPPVSGGIDLLASPSRWLSESPLDLGELLAQTEDPAGGGLVIFSGDVRDHNQGRGGVTAITYEAHPSIAARVLASIEDEVCARFDVLRCRIQHRTGRVEVGQASVLVVCRAAHRAAAFEGARHAIDTLKERTPIWKLEHYDDGSSRYLDGTPLSPESDPGSEPR
ncbi:molybdenum cofactor biosynthesis protein D/E [Lujinxingia litoralis]|uniref:Molybdenum cofactor biosynthesis protein D/E n=1 Tax=Lujinxingia litoralis TaxID=2211119 RepID=A0A328C5F4_9DELT|nr:molybdenum cofactor biosynthesis protein MoaE [Lujinxingia litoralis]RAL21142.1 molybdenum cofactor biosynthesis protein D/E [Lujinxingia litoralis]